MAIKKSDLYSSSVTSTGDDFAAPVIIPKRARR
jgi:hypothetical protein